MFWRAAIDANLALARSRLGQPDAAMGLEETMVTTRRASERYMTTRCQEVLAEIAWAAGDAAHCLQHADELLALAQANGMRELQAVAHHWRGAALLVQQHYAPAQATLLQAMALADAVGRVRLQLDTRLALAQCLCRQGQDEAANSHLDRARVIATAIEANSQSTGLKLAMNQLMPARAW
jgi:tetratricopeptide (TPR) repeat protein